MTGSEFLGGGKTSLIGAILESQDPRRVGDVVNEDERCHLRWKLKR
jgi:G3E family GTPase